MPRFIPDPEVLRLGEALAALRRERGLSQAEAGARLDMTSQGWGLYESGRRPGLFRPDVQRRLTGALDSTPEALALRLSGPSEATISALTVTGLEARGRGFDAPPAVGVTRFRLSNDALSPWASAGVVLEVRPGLWPRPGQGCVIEMKDGDVRARLFDREDASRIHVRGAGSLDGGETLDRAEIATVSAVIARREE
ncbi:helix-turn-helix transcriptional regulator [Brevundimonas sp.]|jgi:transcriptional regulator with XRE-family HTH domain|uniref:helix-turn-helix domain-containing protein n=1 Tax=Brevundimonas sp. TaxID=1871086 RepID=UPI00182FAC53|nr:helix-turn-helix transcriptional regulator [Brevundimonas sp.]MBA4807292.1 helix-turn-helix domain-containing protein [Brevundimonas sp.]